MSITKTVKTTGWLKAAAVRALKTAAEVAVPLVIADTVIWEQNWARVVGVTATATVLSLLWSLRGVPEVDTETDDE
jgi:hypothetical protein